uniref:Uncharacterized protein n=1 Tax=Arundo donax TaxID=35708 RepID=A0A0A9G6V7_ARUDO
MAKKKCVRLKPSGSASSSSGLSSHEATQKRHSDPSVLPRRQKRQRQQDEDLPQDPPASPWI